MNAQLQAYLDDPGPMPNGSHTSLQRQALHEVLRLSAAVVEPLESQIESDYHAARERSQERLATDQGRLDADLQAQSEKTRHDHEGRLATIRANYEQHLGDTKVEAHHGHTRVNQKAAELVTAAEKEHREQMMVAEFVAEGAATRVGQGRVEAQAQFQDARRHLEALAARADSLLRHYRQSLPPPGAGAEATTAVSPPPAGTYQSQQTLAEQHLKALERLFCAQLFAGVRPLLFAGGLLGAAGTALTLLYFLKVSYLPSLPVTGPVAAGLVALLIGLGGRALWRRAKRQVRRKFDAFQEALTGARSALDQQHQQTLQDLEGQSRIALEQKEAESRKARDTLEAAKARIAKQRHTSLQEIDDRLRKTLDHLKQERDQAIASTEHQYQQQQSALEHQHRQDRAEVQARYDREMTAAENEYRTLRRKLDDRWAEGLVRVRVLLDDTATLGAGVVTDRAFDPGPAESWTPPQACPTVVPFGTLELDLRLLADTVLARAAAGGESLRMPHPVVLPALLEFPRKCSMLLQSSREGRPQAIETVRAVMLRLFASLPAGRVRFTILDPVGLGENFAGFMHAGDYQEALVGGRIWTEAQQIQQELEDLTQHIENVIQKYLRNEFDSIEQYNQQAGELAEPYRFLVIADFPTNFNEESARRLSSIIHSGPRCGVHTLIAYDTRHELPPGIDLEDVSAGNVHLVYEGDRYVWRDPILRQFPLTLNRPPDEMTLTKIMHVVGKAGAQAARVEVPFEAVAPAADQIWSLDSRQELCTPLGRTGATRLQYLRLGRGVAQHLLIAGKTGSGKSTLLHVLVTNLALWYDPDQVELYLIDFKQGVEFKTYVTHHLPHARAIAIESDREFGLSILHRLEAEMAQRGELFRNAGVQDIDAYRQATSRPLPRTVLIVDEFQVFFAEDDRLAQDAAVLLEQLVRQGRAFGIHVVLGSQTLGGVFGLARSTMGQMAVRIALQCSEADSQLILDEENVAARLLSRPGEAIYNDAGGAFAANSPFQTAWLPDSSRDIYLTRIGELAHARTDTREPMVVFEGSAPADITENRPLAEWLERTVGSSGLETGGRETSPRIWLGAPVTMKGPTAVTLRRQSGANLLLVGQRDEVAVNLMAAALVSLAAQLPGPAARFVILEGTQATDAPQDGTLARVAGTLPHACRLVPWREVPEVIAELAQEARNRVQTQPQNAPSIFVIVCGLQRYRVLRRSEDALGLSFGDPAEPRPDVPFAELVREGPGVGLHVLAWADTLSTLERTFDRQTLHEFDHRVLLQMSAADSSNLIDSPIANQLGLHRALLYSEEQGQLEKFRPYGVLADDWLAMVRQTLAARAPASDHEG